MPTFSTVLVRATWEAIGDPTPACNVSGEQEMHSGETYQSLTSPSTTNRGQSALERTFMLLKSGNCKREEALSI